MINILEVCNESGILSVVFLVKKLLEIVFFVLPIILIVMILIDFTKNVMAKGDDAIKTNNRLVIKRIVYCIIAFFVPTIVNVVITAVYNVTSDGGNNENALACWEKATVENIETLRAKEEEERKRKEEEKYQQNQNKHNQNEQEMQANQGHGGLSDKKPEQNNGGTVNGNGGATTDPGTTTVNNYTLYVGDSRTVGMCNIVKSSMSSNEECKAKESMGWDWLKKEADTTIREKLNATPTANLVINMGTNDTYNIDGYLKYYKQLREDYINAKIVIVSLTPVDDNKAKANGYKLTNSHVNDFNTKLKSGLSGTNIQYCDVNSQLTVEPYGSRDDGIHHSGDAYRQIYELIKRCL